MDILAPDFALEPEGMWSKLFEGISGKDIDFAQHPIFSKKYYLRSTQENEIPAFFTESLIHFLENREDMHIECYKHRFIFYKKRDLLEPSEMLYLTKFAEDFLEIISANKK